MSLLVNRPLKHVPHPTRLRLRLGVPSRREKTRRFAPVSTDVGQPMLDYHFYKRCFPRFLCKTEFQGNHVQFRMIAL